MTVIPSEDCMSLRLTTLHENRLRPLTPVLSVAGSPIFMAARNLLLAAASGRAVKRSPQGRRVPCCTAQDRDTRKSFLFRLATLPAPRLRQAGSVPLWFDRGPFAYPRSVRHWVCFVRFGDAP